MTGILIPAFNAANTLGELLQQLSKYVHPSDIIVVDDGSTDLTTAIAEQMNAKVLRHEVNRGKGAALRTGFGFIKNSTDYDSVITMDADLQHKPEDIPRFIEARKIKQANLIVGCRPKWGTNMPLPRKLSNTLTSVLVSARTGVTVKDSQCGFRLIGREVLDAVTIESNGYEAETEFLIKAARQEFCIEFIPIKTVYGQEKSYMRNTHTTLQFIKVLFKDY